MCYCKKRESHSLIGSLAKDIISNKIEVRNTTSATIDTRVFLSDLLRPIFTFALVNPIAIVFFLRSHFFEFTQSFRIFG